nr:hypothetical protein [Tanacetum cinerariifolium]
MDANKKVDLENPLCPNESRILANILQNHPLRFSIAASSSVPWIYLRQFWHTLKEDGSKYQIKFMLDIKELTMTLDDFRTIFHLPQATDNNHDRFVPAPKFSEMVPFFKNNLGFTLELRSSLNFKTYGLVQPWQTLCKIFSICLTTRVTGYDQPPLQIIQMMYYFFNNIHVDYADLLWEGFHYSLEHPTTLIPYPRFTKLIVSHYMTAFPEISRRAHEKYHNLEDDEMVKSIFNSWKNKDKGLEEHDATHNVEKLKEHLMAKETEKLVDETENVEEHEVDRFTLRKNDDPNDPVTRLEPRSDKESPEVEITVVVQLVNVTEEEEESVEDDYELKRRENEKHVKEIRNTPYPTTIRSPRTHYNLISSDTEKLKELTATDPPPSSSTASSYTSKSKIYATNRLLSLFKSNPRHFKRYKIFFKELQGRYGYLFEHLTVRFMPRRNFNELAQCLQDIMIDSLPKLVDDRIKILLKTQVPLHVAHGLILERQQSQANVDSSVRNYMSDLLQFIQDQEDHHNDAHPKGENSAKRQKMSEHGTFVFGESSSGQDNKSKPGRSTPGNQEQLDDFDFWTNSYATNDDELPTEKVSQELIDEVREILVPPYQPKPTSVVQSCQRDPKAPILSLINQDLLYLKKGNSGPIKIALSLHKFPTVRFPDNDIEERTSRWVDDYAKTGLLWSLLVFIRSTVIWERVYDFQLVYGIIYKNNKKEKRVMRHQQIHKFCEVTLKRVLEGLKSYNNDVKYGYVTSNLSKEDVEYLKLFEEETKERLKHRDQMRR